MKQKVCLEENSATTTRRLAQAISNRTMRGGGKSMRVYGVKASRINYCQMLDAAFEYFEGSDSDLEYGNIESMQNCVNPYLETRQVCPPLSLSLVHIQYLRY